MWGKIYFGKKKKQKSESEHAVNLKLQQKPDASLISAQKPVHQYERLTGDAFWMLKKQNYHNNTVMMQLCIVNFGF